MPSLSRRALFTMTAGGLLAPAGLVTPRRGLAASASERRFLFVFAHGGWDASVVFASGTQLSGVDTESDAFDSEIDGLRFVDNERRPTVRSFFERYADRCCILNGFEVRSVTHDRCRQILLTGRSDTWADDWPTLLAANSSEPLLLPHLVMSGPAVTNEFSSQVVRVGAAGQLPELLQGDALRAIGIDPVSSDLESMEDAFLRDRISEIEDRSQGRGARISRLYGDALDQLDELDGRDLSLVGFSDLELCGQSTAGDLKVILDCFEAGLSRCGMVRYAGWCANTFDTHTMNDMQSDHFDELFLILTELMEDLEGRTGLSGGSLADEVTVVVCSEMGRSPTFNASMGRNHWTYTSAMLIGAGVRGGQTIGEMDGNWLGRPIDLASGEPTDSGTPLQATHLGATLLAMGDVDPGAYIEGAEPIAAVMADG